MNRKKMRLVSARITNFGCFRDSGEVPIDDVTALIAENENGKTTFLRALAWWSNEDPFDEEDRWQDAGTGEIDLVALTLELSEEALQALEKAGVDTATLSETVRITGNSANEYSTVDAVSGKPITASVGPSKFQVAKENLKTRLVEIGETGDAANYASQLETAEPENGVAEATIASIRSNVIPLVTPEEASSLEQLLIELEGVLGSAGDAVDLPDAYKLLSPFWPNIVYFDETIDYVRDSITYEEVRADSHSSRTMVNLAQVAGIGLAGVAGQDPHARQQGARRAEQTLSTEFSKYWQGDPVTVLVQLDESQMTLTVDSRGRLQRPSRRSSGLKWQLGFFANFRAEVQDDLSEAVVLLDEPGLHLHIKQQPKLLELFDDLAKDGCTIIYSTHLSNMLAPDKPHRFRPVIADPKTHGASTIVPNIVGLPSKSDVLQPVRQALGMGIADALGLGGKTVIAEGWAERYVLLEMSGACAAADKSSLGAAVTVLPAGGSGKKMMPFAAMAVAEKAKVVLLVDDDSGGRSTLSLIDKQLPDAVRCVRTHEEDVQTNMELEDLFSREYYLGLVNSSHADIEGFTPIVLDDIDATKPICDEVKEKFKENGLGDFQKLRPAMELQKQRELGNGPDDASIDQFATLFERLRKGLR